MLTKLLYVLNELDWPQENEACSILWNILEFFGVFTFFFLPWWKDNHHGKELHYMICLFLFLPLSLSLSLSLSLILSFSLPLSFSLSLCLSPQGSFSNSIEAFLTQGDQCKSFCVFFTTITSRLNKLLFPVLLSTLNLNCKVYSHRVKCLPLSSEGPEKMCI
jgi:hypothetical protein